MTANLNATKTLRHVQTIAESNTRTREPSICWRELVQHAVNGSYPSEERLECLLDRIGDSA